MLLTKQQDEWHVSQNNPMEVQRLASTRREEAGLARIEKQGSIWLDVRNGGRDFELKQKVLNAYNQKDLKRQGWQLSVKIEDREGQQGQKRKSNGITKPERLNAGRETEIKMKNPAVCEEAWRATGVDALYSIK